MARQAQRTARAVKIPLSDATAMAACSHPFVKPMEGTTASVNPKANHELRLIIVCQCRPIDWNKCTTLVGDGDAIMGGGLCL